jgi:hypothetical protein
MGVTMGKAAVFGLSAVLPELARESPVAFLHFCLQFVINLCLKRGRTRGGSPKSQREKQESIVTKRTTAAFARNETTEILRKT